MGEGSVAGPNKGWAWIPQTPSTALYGENHYDKSDRPQPQELNDSCLDQINKDDDDDVSLIFAFILMSLNRVE